MSLEEVMSMFQTGHVCCRAWDPATGEPSWLPRELLPFVGNGGGAARAHARSLRALLGSDDALGRAARYEGSIRAEERLLRRLRADLADSGRLPRPAALHPRLSRQLQAGASQAAAYPRRVRRFPTLGVAVRCGTCLTCRNPHWKKACLVRRAEQEAQEATVARLRASEAAAQGVAA